MTLQNVERLLANDVDPNIRQHGETPLIHALSVFNERLHLPFNPMIQPSFDQAIQGLMGTDTLSSDNSENKLANENILDIMNDPSFEENFKEYSSFLKELRASFKIVELLIKQKGVKLDAEFEGTRRIRGGFGFGLINCTPLAFATFIKLQQKIYSTVYPSGFDDPFLSLHSELYHHIITMLLEQGAGATAKNIEITNAQYDRLPKTLHKVKGTHTLPELAAQCGDNEIKQLLEGSSVSSSAGSFSQHSVLNKTSQNSSTKVEEIRTEKFSGSINPSF